MKLIYAKLGFFFLGGTVHPQSQSYFFNAVTNALDVYTGTYDKLLLAGDFNAAVTETAMEEFLYENNLNCIVNDKTCFKNPENPRSIDLFLTNFSNCFQNTSAICTGLSDFHKMIVTVQNIHLSRQNLELSNIDAIKFLIIIPFDVNSGIGFLLLLHTMNSMKYICKR